MTLDIVEAVVEASQEFAIIGSQVAIDVGIGEVLGVLGQEALVVAEGPYRLIRHPGYLGTLLVWIGGGLATANWIIAMTIAPCIGRAYRQRLQAEEAMLVATFRDAYPRYARRTWRLIPFIY